MMTHRALALALAGLPLAVASTAHADRHPVWNLVDNRPLAHLQRRGGLYIEAGAAGFARYVHFSRPIAAWKLRQTEEGRRVALAMADVSLDVPLTAAQAGAHMVHVGLKAPRPSTVRVSAKGRDSAAVALKAGWQVVSVPLPDGALDAGENTLKLKFAQLGIFAGGKAAAAVEWIQVGGAAPTQADPPGRGPSLRVPAGGGLAFFVYLPDGGALSVQGTGGCKLTAQANGGAATEVKLDGTPLEWPRLPGSRPGAFARLDLAATGSCDAVTIQRAELLASGPAPAPFARKPPRNIVLWLSDSTRADKFKIYNPKTRVETPFFQEFAKQATVFKVAYVQGNESRVSHASLFSGVYPGVHQMIPEKAKLNPSFVILPEAVRPSKRFTAGVMGNGFIDKFWGFGDGWDFLRNHIHEGGGLRGEDLLAEGKKLIAQHDGSPWFLYVGSIDAHVSWRAHEPWISRYDSGYNGPFVKAVLDPQLDNILAGKLKITDRDRVRAQALYDSDISYTDSVVKQLFDELKKRNHMDDTMFIFTADHGEELWDHGKVGHGQSLHEELVHVPLVIYYPPYFPAGKVVDEGVDVLDILPTITDALGVATPDAVQGESLIPLVQGIGAGYPRPSIASQYELAHTMRLGRYKLWVGGSGKVELYDMPADPHEDKDLWSSRPVERRALTDAMGTWMAFRNQWKKRKWGVPSNLSAAFAAEMEK